jgi:hypothetical protein
LPALAEPFFQITFRMLRYPPVTVIRRYSNGKVLSPNGLQEQQLLAARIAKCGIMYRTMEQYLEGVAAASKKALTREVLYKLAIDIIRVVRCSRIDRMAARRRAGIICWFVENCTFLLDISARSGLFPVARRSRRENLPVPILNVMESPASPSDEEEYVDWAI